jgi:hypothetical protein
LVQLRAALVLAVALPLCACASDDGLDISETDIDQVTQTGSLPAAQPDPVRNADEAVIRNAVSAADPEQARIQPLAWANADTGSRGAISGLMEKQEDGLLCRKFTATRESFDGVALYSGDACKGDQGAWYMRSFKPL